MQLVLSCQRGTSIYTQRISTALAFRRSLQRWKQMLLSEMYNTRKSLYDFSLFKPWIERTQEEHGEVQKNIATACLANLKGERFDLILKRLLSVCPMALVKLIYEISRKNTLAAIFIESHLGASRFWGAIVKCVSALAAKSEWWITACWGATHMSWRLWCRSGLHWAYHWHLS